MGGDIGVGKTRIFHKYVRRGFIELLFLFFFIKLKVINGFIYVFPIKYSYNISFTYSILIPRLVVEK